MQTVPTWWDQLQQNGRRATIQNGVGSFNHKVGNSVFHTQGLVLRLPLVKHAAFEDEQEHRITISERLGGRTAMQRTALTTLGKPFSDFALGPLQTLDARFRQ
jgi:hypothetical protein